MAADIQLAWVLGQWYVVSGNCCMFGGPVVVGYLQVEIGVFAYLEAGSAGIMSHP